MLIASASICSFLADRSYRYSISAIGQRDIDTSIRRIALMQVDSNSEQRTRMPLQSTLCMESHLHPSSPRVRELAILPSVPGCPPTCPCDARRISRHERFDGRWKITGWFRAILDDFRISLLFVTRRLASAVADKGRVLTDIRTVPARGCIFSDGRPRPALSFDNAARRCEIYCIWRRFYIYDGYREREVST